MVPDFVLTSCGCAVRAGGGGRRREAVSNKGGSTGGMRSEAGRVQLAAGEQLAGCSSPVAARRLLSIGADASTAGATSLWRPGVQ